VQLQRNSTASIRGQSHNQIRCFRGFRPWSLTPQQSVLRGPALQQWYKSNGLEPADKATLTVREGKRGSFTYTQDGSVTSIACLNNCVSAQASYTGRPRDLLYGLLVKRTKHCTIAISVRATDIGACSIGNVVSTLSRYNRRLFCNVGAVFGGSRNGLLSKWSMSDKKSGRRRIPICSASRMSRSLERHLRNGGTRLGYKLLKRIGATCPTRKSPMS